MNFEIKKDKYKLARGKYSRINKLYCSRCNTYFATYQKDGPGHLRRLYFDRIIEPKDLTNLQEKKLSEVKTLKCKNCKEDIGTPYIYTKENRKAFKVYQDMIKTKIRKINREFIFLLQKLKLHKEELLEFQIHD